MSPPVPIALLGVYDAQVYRCACGAWCIGTRPCETCIDLAVAAIEASRTPRSLPGANPPGYHRRQARRHGPPPYTAV